jgi:hypothetical protein
VGFGASCPWSRANVDLTPLTQTAFPEINTTTTHLREVLGGETYESLANAGGNMTPAAMAAYAFAQIDQGCVRPSRASASLSPQLLGDGAELADISEIKTFKLSISAK